MFVTVNKYQHFKSFISDATAIRFEYSCNNAEKSYISNFKTDDYFFKVGYDVFSCVMTCGSSTSQH